MAALTTILAVTAIAASTAAAVEQRRQARNARRDARDQQNEARLAQQVAEREIEANRQRDEVSRSMFDQRRRQRALASIAGGRKSTNTTGLGISGGFGTPTKTAMGA